MAYRTVVCQPKVTSWPVWHEAPTCGTPAYQAKMCPWQGCLWARLQVTRHLCHLASAWGSPPRGWCSSWKSTSCFPPCAHRPLGACQPTAPGPWANEWPSGTSRRRHCCGHGPAGTRCLLTVWWALPCLSLFLSLSLSFRSECIHSPPCQ